MNMLAGATTASSLLRIYKQELQWTMQWVAYTMRVDPTRFKTPRRHLKTCSQIQLCVLAKGRVQ